MRARERETCACGVALPGAPTGTAVAATTAGACTAIPKLWPGPTPIGTCSGGKNIRPHPPPSDSVGVRAEPPPPETKSPSREPTRGTRTHRGELRAQGAVTCTVIIWPLTLTWIISPAFEPGGHCTIICCCATGLTVIILGARPSRVQPPLLCVYTPQSVHALPDSRTILTSCDTCELVSCDSE